MTEDRKAPGVNKMSDVADGADLPESDEMLAELFDRFRARGRGWTGERRPRRSGRRRPQQDADSQVQPGALGGPRARGFDWSIIARMEAEEAARLKRPSGADAGPATECVSQSDTQRSKAGDPSPLHGRADVPAWVPSPGMAIPKTGPGPSRYDPRLLRNVARREVRKRNWGQFMAAGTIVGRWEEIVGDLVAQHCPVESFEDGRLVVRADSSAWSQQLQLLLPQVMARIDETVGPGVVRTVTVRPPRAPSWGHGSLRVPGPGPRDTYG